MDGLIESLAELINNFDPASYLPDIDSILSWAMTFLRICVLAAPVLILVFGLMYWFIPAKEANHQTGYRFWYGMGSVEAWRFTQKIAGIAWTALGLVLTVVMFLVCGSFGEADIAGVVDVATVCILWEIGLMILCCVAIDILLIIRYDRKGVRRKENRRRRREKRMQNKANKNNGIL